MSKSRHILITGVSRGLGLALTEEFIRLGHQVTGCSRSPSAIRELSGRFHAPHDFQVIDVADEQQVARWAQHVFDISPAPDLLINNAAVITPNAVLWETSPANFAQIVDTNIKGVFHV